MLKINNITLTNAIFNKDLVIKSINLEPGRANYLISDTRKRALQLFDLFLKPKQSPGILKVNNVMIEDFERESLDVQSYSNFLNYTNNDTVTSFMMWKLLSNSKFKEDHEEMIEHLQWQINNLIFIANGAKEEELKDYQDCIAYLKKSMSSYYEEAYAKYNFIFDDIELNYKMLFNIKKGFFTEKDMAISLKELNERIKILKVNLLSNTLLKTQQDAIKNIKSEYKQKRKDLKFFEKSLSNKYGREIIKKDSDYAKTIDLLHNQILPIAEYAKELLKQLNDIWKLDNIINKKMSELTESESLLIYLFFCMLNKSQIVLIDYFFKDNIYTENTVISRLFEIISRDNFLLVYSEKIDDVIIEPFDLNIFQNDQFEMQKQKTKNNLILSSEYINKWVGKTNV
ncbi:hypothetical protein ACA758_01260 [Mycoplasmopsis agassizii]|uniref:hypothetical protein n=1 Tax=Mycoplasmopsis agassizii TaxID=33922 RepID=UPI0035290D66